MRPPLKFILLSLFRPLTELLQFSANINSVNLSFPFPQFKAYKGLACILRDQNHLGMLTEVGQGICHAYSILYNNLRYNVDQNCSYAPVSVAGLEYSYAQFNHWSVEDIGGDPYTF